MHNIILKNKINIQNHLILTYCHRYQRKHAQCCSKAPFVRASFERHQTESWSNCSSSSQWLIRQNNLLFQSKRWKRYHHSGAYYYLFILLYFYTLEGSVLNVGDLVAFQTEISECGHREVEGGRWLDASNFVAAQIDVIEKWKLVHLSRHFV